ncbi:hypothetical protein TAMA11512_20290 [Selenomonas sp. TAMA-11512]|uniref:hypothetical protein n=1 Tax=Selenomonas sp. TAMA-11512 TaxID=3095337 RepID=UPI0030872418|nr:hypothetical protein TAMA11512_20290 [Selenomonas sp. TAMA-11512]
MKKIALLVALGVLTTTTAFAQPIQKSGAHDTTVGVGTEDMFIEHKLNNRVTLGYARADRDSYDDQNDYYAQYDLVGNNVKLLGGYRNHLPGDENNFYAGLALSSPTIPVIDMEAYTSFITGADFNEFQVGLNKNLLLNVDLNVNYHNFSTDYGKDEHGVGVGVNVKF